MLHRLTKLVLLAAYFPVVGMGAQMGPPGVWAGNALAEALAIATQIEDPYRRAQAFADIGHAQLGAGKITDGRETLGLALATSAKIGVEALRSWVLHDIALAQMKTLDAPAEVLVLVDQIREPRARDSALMALARALRSRDQTASVAIAKRIHNAAQQGRVLWEIAVTQAENGYPEEGLATARSIVNSSLNALALGDVVAAYAAQGDVQQAKLLSSRIRNDLYRARATGRIAGAQAAKGDIQGALATAGNIKHKLSRAQALSVIGAALADRGDVTGASELFEMALKMVRSERRGGRARSAALAEIARAQMSLPDTQAARRTVSELIEITRGERLAADRLDTIARLQAKAGDYAGARSTASQVSDTGVRALLIRDIMTEQARSGDIAGALAAARQLEADQSAALAISAIVAVQASADDPGAVRDTIDLALPIVRRVDPMPVRAGALASLASALVKARDVSAAGKVFAEAMTLAGSTSERPQQVSAFIRIADNLGYGLD